MKSYTLIFFSLFIQIIHSQEINVESRFTISQNYIYLAELEFANANFPKSNEYFSKAFKYHQALDSYQMLDAAACALHINNDKLFKKYVVKAIVEFKAPIDFILEYDKFKDYKNNEFLKSLINNYDYYLNQYYANYDNLSALMQVSSLVEKDQITRQLIEDIKNENNSSQTEIDKNISNKILEKTDDYIAQKLIAITQKYGFQKYSWIILWHHRITYNDQSDKFWQYFKPIISSEIKKGRLHKSYLASFIDVNESIWNQKQIYGTLFQYPIDNIKDIDFLRESVGLPPLLYDKIIYGRSLPDYYKLSNIELKKMLMENVGKYNSKITKM